MSIWFRVINCHLFPPEQLLWGGGDEAIISDGRKKDLKDTYQTSGLILWRMSWELSFSAELFLINPIIISLFHTKITVNITKKLHQDCGPCYLHLPNIFLNIHSPLLKENKKLLWLLFFSVNKDTDHCLMVYYETIPVWGLVSLWLTNATHCLF